MPPDPVPTLTNEQMRSLNDALVRVEAYFASVAAETERLAEIDQKLKSTDRLRMAIRDTIINANREVEWFHREAEYLKAVNK